MPVVTGESALRPGPGLQVPPSLLSLTREEPGVAGNVGAIFVSRISTALHGAKEERYFLTAGTLFGISSPILIAFLGFVWLTGQMRIGFAFGLSYILLSFGIVSI